MGKKIRTILLVDDDHVNNFINARLLRKLDIAEEITVVLNGEEAVKCLYDHCFKTHLSPELIFLDINMPVMDGFEFLRVFNELDFTNKDQVRIVVLTTSSNMGDKHKMEQLGIKYYIDKPLTEEKLSRFIHFIIEHGKQSDTDNP